MNETEPVLPPELVARILAALSQGGSPAPSADLKSRLMERIARETEREGITVRSLEGSWTPLLAGVQVKVLRDDGSTRTWLAKMAVGAALPAHEHLGDEECFVLDGTIDIGGERFHAGDYQVARAGTRHGVLATATGCILLLRSASRPAAGG